MWNCNGSRPKIYSQIIRSYSSCPLYLLRRTTAQKDAVSIWARASHFNIRYSLFIIHYSNFKNNIEQPVTDDKVFPKHDKIALHCFWLHFWQPTTHNRQLLYGRAAFQIFTLSNHHSISIRIGFMGSFLVGNTLSDWYWILRDLSSNTSRNPWHSFFAFHSWQHRTSL